MNKEDLYQSCIGKYFIKIKQVTEFEKDLKKLMKRFPTLKRDLQIFIQYALYPFHKFKIDNQGIVRITGTNVTNFVIYKARKVACRALKGRGAQTGLRIIYAYYESEDSIEFIEMYFKGDKENESRERIEKYLKIK